MFSEDNSSPTKIISNALEALDNKLANLYKSFYTIVEQILYIQMRQKNAIKKNEELEKEFKVSLRDMHFFFFIMIKFPAIKINY